MPCLAGRSVIVRSSDISWFRTRNSADHDCLAAGGENSAGIARTLPMTVFEGSNPRSAAKFSHFAPYLVI